MILFSSSFAPAAEGGLSVSEVYSFVLIISGGGSGDFRILVEGGWELSAIWGDMIGDSIGDVASGIFGSMGLSAGFANGEEDGISAYALVERREDIRCCWLEISLPTPIAQNRANMIDF